MRLRNRKSDWGILLALTVLWGSAFLFTKLAVDSIPPQLNYFIPLWAVLVGTVFLDEQPEAIHLLALSLILAGVLVSQFEYRSLRAGRRTREEARSVA